MRTTPKYAAVFVAIGAIFVGATSTNGSEVPTLWEGFYTPKSASTVSSAPQEISSSIVAARACVHEILLAQVKYGIPDNLLLAIGVQEAGKQSELGLAVWPWTINANGVGQYFTTQGKAIARVKELQSSGINSIDIGCMQINQRWHGHKFDGIASAFNPKINVDYAARFLLSLYQATGDWEKAAGNYHSRNKENQDRYLAALKINQKYVQKNLSQMVALGQKLPQDNAKVATPPPPLFWSAFLSRDSGQKTSAFSIYSSKEIRAIIPDFQITN